MKRGLYALLAAAAVAMTSLTAHAALLPRDIDGGGVVDAYYDTAQDITWFADWSVSGKLTWDQAVAWAASLNVHGVGGWRLPHVVDTGNPGCDFSVAGGTDCGYNVDTETSELARMWYVTLGNLAFCARDNSICDLQGPGQSGWGLTNTGPFRNMQSGSYWSGTEYSPDKSEAWSFATDDGGQDSEAKTSSFYAVAVHAGDVAPAPVAYNVIDLGPGVIALGAGDGQQVGGAGHALLWTGRADSLIDLHPPGFSRSIATGVASKRQVGYGIDAEGVSHAFLWTGSATSAVDLNPAGFSSAGALGADIGHQAGWGTVGSINGVSHALLWSGSAASVLDLHPTGFTTSQAWAVGDGQQAGFGASVIDGHSHALLWSGDAASAVDLHPAGFISSAASGVAGGRQVGTAVDQNGFSHAVLWTGSPHSVVDLSPAGFVTSQAKAVAGGQQVGLAASSTLGLALGATRAIMWTGSAASAVNLHSFIPGTFFGASSAQGIDDAGNIVGSAGHFGPCRYGFCRPIPYAILWVPVLPFGLDIIETASPDPVLPGEKITYSITVTNSRSGTATGVLVTDAIAAETLVSATTDRGSCSGTDTVICDLGALPGGSSAHITLVVQLSQGFAGSSVKNGASVEADQLMTISTAVGTSVVQVPDLAGNWQNAKQTCKTKRGVTTCTIKGNLNVVNQGRGTASACVARFYLSDDTTFDASDVLLSEMTIPTLGAGATHLLRVKTLLPPGSSASGKFVIAVLDAAGIVTESDESNNSVASARLP